jgi:hypothetical protein
VKSKSPKRRPRAKKEPTGNTNPANTPPKYALDIAITELIKKGVVAK